MSSLKQYHILNDKLGYEIDLWLSPKAVLGYQKLGFVVTELKEECPFCKMKDELDENEIFLRSNPKRNRNNWTRKATVALVDESYYNGEYTGSATYHDYELNFCPVCGKPFKANEK